MKKMIFTAMTVLAFSAVSVANTIEVKEEVVVNNESKVEVLNAEEVATPCEDAAAITVSLAEEEYHNETGNCFDSWVYNYIYLNAMLNCK